MNLQGINSSPQKDIKRKYVSYSWNTIGYLKEKEDTCYMVRGTEQIQVELKEDCLYKENLTENKSIMSS